MTLQQLEYIVAVDTHRHFVRAAEACGVTQSTLSAMIRKLETELDVQIFDRESHPVRPTAFGEQLLRQARVLLYNASQFGEMARAERSADTGELKLGVIPTVAPYVLPQLFRAVLETLPGVLLRASESRTELLVRKLKLAELDVALMSTPIEDDELLQIPLYYEKFLAYVSPGEPLHARREIDSREMPSERLWVLQEGHCLRNQVMNLCGRKSDYSAYYEAGSIDTLVRIVDLNGGYTVIPELHVALLREAQKSCVRPLVNPEPVREISFVIRRDFVRERLLNRLADVLRAIIPEPMLDMRLKKFAIRL